MDIQDYMDRAEKIFKLLEEALSMGDIKLDYVLKTGFISWLNQDDNRIDRYLQGDNLKDLVLEFVDEITKEDELDEDEIQGDILGG